MRRSMLFPILMAAGLSLALGCRATPDQAGASRQETGAPAATPRAVPSAPASPPSTPFAPSMPAASAPVATASTAVRYRPRPLAAPQNQSRSQAQASTPAASAPDTTDPGAQDAALARQQAEQAARLARDQQQVLHQYSRSQRQMQEEPRNLFEEEATSEDLRPLLKKPLDLLVCELSHFQAEDLFLFLRGHAIKRIVFMHVGRPYWENLPKTRRLAEKMLGGIPFVFARDGQEFTL